MNNSNSARCISDAAVILTCWIVCWSIYAISLNYVCDFGRCDFGIVYLIMLNGISISPFYAVISATVKKTRFDNLVFHSTLGYFVSLIGFWVLSLMFASTDNLVVMLFDSDVLKVTVPGIFVGMICFWVTRLLNRTRATVFR